MYISMPPWIANYKIGILDLLDETIHKILSQWKT